MHNIVSLADNADFNNITNSGWYNTYSLVNAPDIVNKTRYNIKVEQITLGGSVTVTQTAFYNMGGGFTKPKQRHTYYTLEGALSWSPWY